MKRYRKPSFKKSFSAKTTGHISKTVKSTYTPNYGKKGNGWITDPKKATYNHVYNRTTQSVHSKNTHHSSNVSVGGILNFIALSLELIAILISLVFSAIPLILLLWFIYFILTL
jgi:hypothetical protein